MQNSNKDTKFHDGSCYSTNVIQNTRSKHLSYCYMCRNIFNHYGIDNQKNQLIQELSELIVAITKNDLENVIEEMADVLVVLSECSQYHHDNCVGEDQCIEDLELQIENMRDKLTKIYKIVSYKLALNYDVTGKLQEIKDIIEEKQCD